MSKRPDPSDRRLEPVLAILIASQIAFLSFDFTKIGLTARGGIDIGRWMLIAPGQVVGGLLLLTLSSELWRSLRRGPVFVAALWLVWGLSSTFWSVDPRQTFLQSLGAINLFLVAVWLVQHYGTEAFYRLSSRAIAVVVAAGVLYQGLIGLDRDTGRLEGLSEGFNQLGIQCALGVLLAAAARRQPDGNRTDTFTAGFLFVALLATGARGPLAGTLLGLGLLSGPLLANPRRRIPVLGASALGVFALVLAQGTGTFARGDADVLNGRGLIWDYAFELVGQAPLTGHGMMTGLSLWTEAVVAGAVGFKAGSAHSLLLEVLVGGGTIGLALFLGALGLVVRGGIRSRDWARLAIVATILTSGLTESLVARPSLTHWVLGGLVSAAVFAPPQTGDTKDRRHRAFAGQR